MATLFNNMTQYMASLKEKLEDKILVTLKHNAKTQYSHNQLFHGMRYGINVLRPNGVGKASAARGRAYLAKLQKWGKVGVGKINSSGARGKRVMQTHGVRNMLMEAQRRENTGGRRWNHGKRDPNYGKQTNLQQRLQAGPRKALFAKRTETRLAKNPKPEGARKSNLWKRTLPQLINPTGNPVKDAKLAKLAKNRVYGKMGMANPKKNQNKKFEKLNAENAQKILDRIRYQDPRKQQSSDKKPIRFVPQKDLGDSVKKTRAKLVRSKKELKSLINDLIYMIAQKESNNNFEISKTAHMQSLTQTLKEFHSYIKYE